jgi:hypothetical protein
MNLTTLKAKNLKNKPRNYWQKNGFHVSHLFNGYWLTFYNYSKNFNTLQEVKNKINEVLN